MAVVALGVGLEALASAQDPEAGPPEVTRAQDPEGGDLEVAGAQAPVASAPELEPTSAQVPRVGSVELAILGAVEPRSSTGRGISVAVSWAGDRAIVGSARDGARIYALVDGAWRLEHAVPHAPLRRGAVVALSGDGSRALVGGAVRSGWRVRVLARLGSEWTQRCVLEGPDRSEVALALSGDGTRALVGVPNASSAGRRGAGRVEAYVLFGAEWTREAAWEVPSGGAFGTSVALSADGSTALVGAPSDPGGPTGSGAAYVLARLSGGWSVAARLTGSRPASGDRFGEQVALSADGQRALVGAPGDDVDAVVNAGSVRLFGASGPGGWVQRGDLPAPTLYGEPARELGAAIALSADGTRALVATARGPNAGAWIYAIGDQGGWLTGHVADGTGGAHRFGASLALSSDGRVALAGTPGDEIEGYAASGSCRVFALASADGTGLPPPPPTLAEPARAAIAQARADRTMQLHLERVLVQSVALLPLLAGTTYLTFLLATSTDAAVSGTVRVFLPIGVLAGAVLGALTVTGVGEAMGGRGHFGGALAGLAVGLALGVGVVAGAYGLAQLRPPGSSERAATLLGGSSLAAVLAGAGAIAGYTLWDVHERAQAEIELLPIAALGPDGGSIGIQGAF